MRDVTGEDEDERQRRCAADELECGGLRRGRWMYCYDSDRE